MSTPRCERTGDKRTIHDQESAYERVTPASELATAREQETAYKQVTA